METQDTVVIPIARERSTTGDKAQVQRDLTAKHGTEVRCGDCMHFKTGPASTLYPGLCKDQGTKTFSPICQGFNPDVTLLNSVDPSVITEVRAVLAKCNAQQARVLAHLFSRKTWNERNKVAFGDPIYFVLGQEYLGNIVRGFLVGVSKGGDEYTIVSALEGLQKKLATARLMASSVLNETQYLKLRAQLIKQGRIMEPGTGVMKVLRMTKKQREAYEASLAKKPDQYEPPTIDSVPAKWLDQRVIASLADKKTAVKKTSTKNVKITKGSNGSGTRIGIKR